MRKGQKSLVENNIQTTILSYTHTNGQLDSNNVSGNKLTQQTTVKKGININSRVK